MKLEKLTLSGDHIKAVLSKVELEIIHDALIIAHGTWYSNTQNSPMAQSLNPYSGLELDARIYLEGN